MWRLVFPCMFMYAILPVWGEEALTLERAVEIAVDNNFELAERRLRSVVPGLQVDIEKAAFRWKVRPFFGLETSEDEVALSRVGTRLDKQLPQGALFQTRGEWITREEGLDEQTVDVTLEQPLFRRQGSLWAGRGVDAAQYQSRVAEWTMQRETEALILRVVDAYTEVLRQERREREEAEALEGAQNLVRLVEVRQRQGRANGVDVLEMRLLQQEAQQRHARARQRSEDARTALAELLGRAPEQLPPLTDVAPPGAPDLSPMQMLETARSRRSEFQQALAAYEEARRMLSLQRRELYPDVRLVARWRPVSESDAGAWFAGLSGGQTLDLHVTRLEIRREETAVAAALAAITALELRLDREVRQARDRLRFAREDEETARTRAALAVERLRLARALYPLGRMDATRVREAEESLSQARGALGDAQMETVRAAYALRRSLGLLLGEAETKPPVTH